MTTKRKEADHIPWVWGSVPRALRVTGNFSDWRCFVFCGNEFWRSGQIGFSCWKLILAIFRKYPVPSIDNIFKRGSRINTDRFPKRGTVEQASRRAWGHAPRGISIPKVPFPRFLIPSCERWIWSTCFYVCHDLKATFVFQSVKTLNGVRPFRSEPLRLRGISQKIIGGVGHNDSEWKSF